MLLSNDQFDGRKGLYFQQWKEGEEKKQVLFSTRFLFYNMNESIKLLMDLEFDFSYAQTKLEADKKSNGIHIWNKKNINDIEVKTIPAWREVIPDDKDRVKAVFTDLLTKDETVSNSTIPLKRIMVAEDGTILTVNEEVYRLVKDHEFLNQKQFEITIPAGRNNGAIVVNYNPGKKLTESDEYFIFMPVMVYGDQEKHINSLDLKYENYADMAPEVKSIPEEIEEPEEETADSIEQNIPDEAHIEKPIEETEEQSAEITEQKTVSKEEASELFAKVKASHPYKSFDYANKLLNILINSNTEEVDSLNAENGDHPATYKQTKAIWRTIFGRHYTHETFEALMQEIH